MASKRLRLERYAELNDTQIDTLIGFGKREGELLDELTAAVRANDRDLAWQIAEALNRIEDEARQAGSTEKG